MTLGFVRHIDLQFGSNLDYIKFPFHILNYSIGRYLSLKCILIQMFPIVDIVWPIMSSVFSRVFLDNYSDTVLYAMFLWRLHLYFS